MTNAPAAGTGTATPRILFLSNGHGEDEIAGKLIDALRREAGPVVPELDAWPMVGQGRVYRARGITPIGPVGQLPSEGFSTLSLRHLWGDLAGGWPALMARQWRFARGLRGRYRLLVGVGDIVPLLAGWQARTPMAFVACAKSSFYGRRHDNNALERWLMRRVCVEVFPRDGLSAQRLRARGVACSDLGNPMMDGLDPVDPPGLRGGTPLAVALLPGSRRDATDNAILLVAAAGRAVPALPAGSRFLVAAHEAVDFARLAQAVPAPWLRGAAPEGAGGGGAADAVLRLVHPSGSELLAVKGRFADVLHASDLAVGMAGTANEQAIGLGLPLVVVPGRGNQGAAYVRMKMRYFGPAAVAAAPEAGAIAAALCELAADPARRATMAAEGRRRMGAPGASRAIARALLQRLEASGAGGSETRR